ncbi:SusC/RagA family TonB-linked outer membrane protein [Mucilaginibacter sp. OK098]|uniref:SusC/RagA family TonB-linked outer membrane protein n=1 Tax=Mucilaginibacter sp. OK098 TaxID=1855297 RepID=UPI0009249385|nr:TonB-dependent receptor [Mucilaginibacter sp. OK098]SHM59493.1 TonB-linked outer membrane protein, SusC/RagA family [Mucilaginibacter sp. OK098]
MSSFYKKQALLTSLLLMFSIIAFAQVRVTGVVKDTEGQVIPAVTVAIKGTTNAVSTANDGKFAINAPVDGVLTFSFIGYVTKSVSINGKTNLEVTLSVSSKTLEEVVVVAYGTQKKVNLTGSVNTVNTKELINRPVTSLTNALQGIVPGVTIISRPGDVGNDVGGVNIRGRGNLGSSGPLYIIDGVPEGASDFALINSNDVESISFLKDASASAMYGSRAAYGVILVTTKKGKEGKTTINYNAYYASQKATVLPSWLRSYDYATLLNEATTNAGGTPVFDSTALQKIKDHSDPDHYPDNNWYSLTLRKSAPMTEHELNISGGNTTRYFLSGSYFDQNSLLPNKALQRYSFRSNIESQVSDHFKVGSNISFVRSDVNNQDGTINFTTLNRETPLLVNKQSNGEWGSINGGKIDPITAGNTVRTLQEGGRSSSSAGRFIGSVNGDYTPIKGLNINGLVSYNTYNGPNTDPNVNNGMSSHFTSSIDPLLNFNTGAPISGTGVTPNQLDEAWETTNNLLTQFTASYEKKIGKHYFKIFAGTSYEANKDRVIEVIRKNFPTNDLDAINAGSAVPENTTSTGNIQQYALESAFSRLNYSYNNKYLLEANMRVDGASQFAPGHRTGYFPSVSGGWRVSQEDFMKSITWISELKLRASWGKLGNIKNVGDYDFYDGLNTGTAAILDQSKQDGVWPGKLANPLLSWEKINATNIGLDAGLFNNSLNLQVDVFNRMTNGILVTQTSLPDEAGLTSSNSPSVNLARVQNKGIELSLNYNNHIGDLKFSVGGNLTRIWNKIVSMGLAGGLGTSTTGNYYVNMVGQAIGSFYMYKSDGLFTSNAEVAQSAKQYTGTQAGDIKYVDENHDGKIDANDRVVVGNDVPNFTYGLNVNASYKNFDFSVIGQGISGVKVYLEDEASQAFFNGAGVKAYVLDRWTPANPNANAPYPRLLTSQNNSQNLVQSDYWLFNADYFRVKSLTLGYTIPKSSLEKIGVRGLRVYLSSNNPFTIRGDKRLKDFDPEAPSARASYPQLKSYSIGVNLTL